MEVDFLGQVQVFDLAIGAEAIEIAITVVVTTRSKQILAFKIIWDLQMLHTIGRDNVETGSFRRIIYLRNRLKSGLDRVR